MVGKESLFGLAVSKGNVEEAIRESGWTNPVSDSTSRSKFLVADWHLGEDRFEIMQRPYRDWSAYISDLINKHNSIVLKDDLVYVIGDVCYNKRPDCLKYVSEFNGRKILIKGNHDRDISNCEFSKYFEAVIEEGNGLLANCSGLTCYLTHYPTCGVKNYLNIVGHIHGIWKYQLNMINVGVDVHHFYPVNANMIPKFFKAIEEYYDDDAWASYSDLNAEYYGKRGKKGTYFSQKG